MGLTKNLEMGLGYNLETYNRVFDLPCLVF
jgi:hypothetical protein